MRPQHRRYGYALLTWTGCCEHALGDRLLGVGAEVGRALAVALTHNPPYLSAPALCQRLFKCDVELTLAGKDCRMQSPIGLQRIDPGTELVTLGHCQLSTSHESCRSPVAIDLELTIFRLLDIHHLMQLIVPQVRKVPAHTRVYFITIEVVTHAASR
ncbi:hypothetical protein D3C80_1035970 [compost metagenome]